MPWTTVQAKEAVRSIIDAEALTSETFYLALKLLKDDIESSLSLYHQSLSSGSQHVLSTDSISLLMQRLLHAGQAEEAMRIYQATFEDHNNLPIDIFIANLVLRIFARLKLSDDEKVVGVMSLINRLQQDQVLPHHSTLAIAFKILIEAKSIASVRILESIMKDRGIPHSNITRQAMMEAFRSIEDYDSMMSVYHDGINARILPSSNMIIEVIRLLTILGENAISVRVLYIYLIHHGRLDWNLIEASIPLFRPNRKISSRKIYPSTKTDRDETTIENVDGKQPRSHLDNLQNLVVDMKSNFQENIFLYNQRKGRLIEIITKLIINSIDIVEGNSQIVPKNIIFAFSSHIVIQGGIDKLMQYVKARQIFEPPRFWAGLMTSVSENYPKEWRVQLQLYERMRHDASIGEQDRLDGLRHVAISMIRANQTEGAINLLRSHLHTLSPAARQSLRENIKAILPKNMLTPEVINQLE